MIAFFMEMIEEPVNHDPGVLERLGKSPHRPPPRFLLVHVGSETVGKRARNGAATTAHANTDRVELSNATTDNDYPSRRCNQRGVWTSA